MSITIICQFSEKINCKKHRKNAKKLCVFGEYACTSEADSCKVVTCFAVPFIIVVLLIHIINRFRKN